MKKIFAVLCVSLWATIFNAQEIPHTIKKVIFLKMSTNIRLLF